MLKKKNMDKVYESFRIELTERIMKEQQIEVAFILKSLCDNGPERTDEIISEAVDLYQKKIRSVIRDKYVGHIIKILIDQDLNKLKRYIKRAQKVYAEMLQRELVNGGHPCCTSCLGLT